MSMKKWAVVFLFHHFSVQWWFSHDVPRSPGAETQLFSRPVSTSNTHTHTHINIQHVYFNATWPHVCLCLKVWGFAEFPIRLWGSLLCSSNSFSFYSSCSCSHMSSSGHKFRVNQAEQNITSVSYVYGIMFFFVCLFVSVFDRKRNQTERPQKKQAYIKKPLNAFMLFMKEQRPTVRPAIRCQGSGAVNAFLGTVVRVLSWFVFKYLQRLISGWFSPDCLLPLVEISESERAGEILPGRWEGAISPSAAVPWLVQQGELCRFHPDQSRAEEAVAAEITSL